MHGANNCQQDSNIDPLIIREAITNAGAYLIYVFIKSAFLLVRCADALVKHTNA